MSKNNIHTFLNCRKCVEERKAPNIEVGITPTGIKVWCCEHQMEIVELTPWQLQEKVDRGAHCDQCEQGVPHKH